MHLHTLLWMLPLVDAATVHSLTKRAEPAPILRPRDAAAILADKYIVRLRDDIPAAQVETLMDSIKEEAHEVYKTVFPGFSATLDTAGLERWRNHPDVEYIEHDSKYTPSRFRLQKDAPWGLSRISAHKMGASKYIFDESAGEGTCTYVLDTGIDFTHPEFEGRAEQIHSYFEDEPTDGEGHGTHVAGIIGSKTYGVAKKTRLYGVKILGDSGSSPGSIFIAGADLVLRDMKKRSCPKGVFVNLSLSGPPSVAANEAASKLVKAGIFVGVAAGNQGGEAMLRSPASAESVCVVGGSTEDDSWFKESNYGARIDILAPAAGIRSTLPGGAIGIADGTSMAAPHVVGVAAYLGALNGINGSAPLCSLMREMAHRNAIKGVPRGTKNLLLFNNAA
ncbi:hypothetical protein JDV02_006395 [Purpureocillium takamizusanense]|uniref:Uncharacterized protein n=1 Tax=Purpureocillium takamizusanense TaxID=2060973 RepID=A0A9Q8QIK0_9HYPO|nr:uncharacterized protein JDV02_006395 [Purpureocillium takamizusanense]UNI20295.1 hypothetical protein JDV02_006395 [Purpureocillium takamizusanense]